MFPDSQWGAQNAKLCCSTEGLYGQWFQTKNKNRSIRDFEQRIFCRLLGPTYSSQVWYVPMVLSVWILGPWLVLQAMKPLRCEIYLVEVGHWIWTSETYTPPSPRGSLVLYILVQPHHVRSSNDCSWDYNSSIPATVPPLPQWADTSWNCVSNNLSS